MAWLSSFGPGARLPEHEITVLRSWLENTTQAGLPPGLQVWDLHIVDSAGRRYLVPGARCGAAAAPLPAGVRIRLRVAPVEVA
jgi:hypothetical protein